MTRAMRFTRSEIANAAKLCREQGVIVKLTRDGAIVVYPDTHAKTLDPTDDDVLDAQLAAFEAEHGED